MAAPTRSKGTSSPGSCWGCEGDDHEPLAEPEAAAVPDLFDHPALPGVRGDAAGAALLRGAGPALAGAARHRPGLFLQGPGAAAADPARPPCGPVDRRDPRHPRHL